MPPGEKHEKALYDAIEKLRAEGYHVIKTNYKIPDAIAVKNGKVYAVEMMGQKWSRNRGWQNKYTKRQKEIDYDNFDGLLFFKFRYERHPQSKGDGGRTSGIREEKP